MAVDGSLPVALHCIPVPEFGGVARYISDIAEAGLPGYRLVVLCPAGALSQRLKGLGAQVIEADFGTTSGFLTSIRTLNAAIDELHPAVVHSHLAYADVVAAATVNLRKMTRLIHPRREIPHLYTTEHGIAGNDSVYHGNSWRARLMELVHRVRLWGTDGAVAVSQSTAEQMKRKWGAKSVQVIYNGIDIPQVAAAVDACRTAPDSDALRVLSLSRLAPEKGLDILIEAFSHVLRKKPAAKLEIAGVGKLRQSLEEQVASLGITDSVTFSGFVSPSEAMGRSDLLVQLSVWENCSYTLLDAKAAKLAVVATEVGGNPEILEKSELVPALSKLGKKDAVEAVTNHLLEITVDQQNDFSWPSRGKMVEELVSYYRRGA